MLSILICDDHMVVRRGLRAILVERHGMGVVGEAANGVEAVALARELQPDVILMDLAMPIMGGVEAIQAIRTERPDAHILVLTSFGDDAQVIAALRAGALGYLLKDSSSEELLEAIRQVSEGNLWLPAHLAAKIMQALNAPPAPVPPAQSEYEAILDSGAILPLSLLTDREKEVLDGIADGLSNQEIAGRLMIGVTTVRTHVSSILAKLNLENRTQAALLIRNLKK